MEIEVKVFNVLEPQSFTSKKDGGVVKKYSFIGKTNEQYPKTICFTCMGDELWQKLHIMVGKSYSLGINISSREWNGRWFTEISVWKAVCLEQQQGNYSQQVKQQDYVQPAPQPTSQQQTMERNDDLPF